MQLIIKPTGACNFNCKFCSAHDLTIQHPSDGKVPDKIKELIETLNPNSIIITGGEPLMVPPDYYYELHEFSGCNISATTNLKDFYNNPTKWSDLFNEKWFGVATSFNYGDTRMWDKDTIYTEDMFLKVMDQYLKYVNKPIPLFISVIDESNEYLVMDHVYLAKRINSRVKLNNAIGVGLQAKNYPRYKMYQYYIRIIDEGLEYYESNCADRKVSRCPKNIDMSCANNIRCCYVDPNNILHVGLCDEQLSMGNELPYDQIKTVNNDSKNVNDYINDECIYCELCRLCNGCSTNKYFAKKDPNYCSEMKKLKSQIIDHGWLL